MPTAQLFATRKARRIALLAALTVLTVVLTSHVTTQTSLACPAPPAPLRALYSYSDLIVVGHFSEAVPVELITSEEESEYKRYLMRSELKVTSTVKGVGDAATVHVYHWGWTNDGEVQHQYTEHSNSAKLLVFLTRRENADGYEVADNPNGVKRLSDADLKVYLERLDELGLILQLSKPDSARLVEWFVRCAEEPATRSEGLRELSMSYYALVAGSEPEPVEVEAKPASETKEGASDEANHAGKGSSEGNAEESDKDDAGEITSEQIVDLPMMRRGFDLGSDPEYIRSLTHDQKRRLTNVLFNAKPLTYDESPLIELVQQWNDSRLVPYVVSQLRDFADDPRYIAQTLVGFLAETLKDEELTRLGTKYCENASYEDEVEDAAPETESTDETESEPVAQEQTQEKTEAKAEESAPNEELVVGSDKQKRSIRLQRFIARAERVLAQ